MSWKTNYPLNGIWCFINFPELLQLSRTDYPIVTIGEYKWRLSLRAGIDATHIYPVLECLNIENDQHLFVGTRLSIVNQKPELSKIFEEKQEIAKADEISKHILEMADVFDEAAGWLVNGQLTIEYGVHVIGSVGEDKIRMFNVYETMPDMVPARKYWSGSFHVHKKLLLYHTNEAVADEKYMELAMEESHENVDQCLQIAQGVRMQLNHEDIPRVAEIAQHYKLRNVSRYCEMKYMEMKMDMKNEEENLKIAISNNWNHYLAVLLKDLGSSNPLKSVLKSVDMQKVSGGTMKRCVEFIFEL